MGQPPTFRVTLKRHAPVKIGGMKITAYKGKSRSKLQKAIVKTQKRREEIDTYYERAIKYELMLRRIDPDREIAEDVVYKIWRFFDDVRKCNEDRKRWLVSPNLLPRRRRLELQRQLHPFFASVHQPLRTHVINATNKYMVPVLRLLHYQDKELLLKAYLIVTGQTKERFMRRMCQKAAYIALLYFNPRSKKKLVPYFY